MFTILMMAMVTTQGASGDDLRKAYSNCMVDVTVEHLDKDSSKRVFEKAAEEACPTERTAYIDALVKDEKDYGATDDEAREYATEEADGVMIAMVDSYEDLKASNSRPTKE